MRFVVGLGNPGREYEGHRHNAGFMVADRLASDLGAGPFREKFKAQLTTARAFGQDIAILKPQTYMNLSGESVQKAMQFYKVALPDVIVAHDELDLPFGAVRIKVGGGAAGHNGLKSIIQHCGGPDFVRVRIGIGRPRAGAVESYVLSGFDSSERAELDDVLREANACLRAVLEHGAARAMNERHGAPAQPKDSSRRPRAGADSPRGEPSDDKTN